MVIYAFFEFYNISIVFFCSQSVLVTKKLSAEVIWWTCCRVLPRCYRFVSVNLEKKYPHCVELFLLIVLILLRWFKFFNLWILTILIILRCHEMEASLNKKFVYSSVLRTKFQFMLLNGSLDNLNSIISDQWKISIYEGHDKKT